MGRSGPLPPCLGEESPVGDQPSDYRDMVEPSMENLTWVIVATGVSVGGLIMMFGFRKTDHKPMAFGRIERALKQDWMRTGNIDFYASALESSSRQPSGFWSRKLE
jgi:hypothetical protein